MKRFRILQRAYMFAIFSFLFAPIAVMVAFSFNESKSRSVWTGFTTKWYVNLFHNEMILQSLMVSLVIGLLSAGIATVLGTMASIGINSMGKKARSAILTMSYIPVINPEIITGVSMMLLFVVFNSGMSTWLSAVFKTELSFNSFGVVTLLIAHITFNIPYVIFNVSPKLRKMDVRVYEAALDLGCNPNQAFYKVVLPEIMPAVLASFLICLTYSIDDFIISYFTSGTLQSLPIAIYSMTKKKVSPEINALSTIMFGAVLLFIFVSTAIETRREKRIERAARKAEEEQ